MALSATLVFYAQFTNAGVGATGLTVTCTIKKLTRAVPAVISTVTTGGAITVGSVVETDSTNAKGLYHVAVSGLDPAADYIAAFSTSGTADLKDQQTLWSEFSPSINAGAVPQVTAGASGGVLISGTNSGTVTLGALTVSGATTLAAISMTTITASGAVAFQSTFNITGTSTWTGAVAFSNGLTSNITGNLVGSVSTVGGQTLANLDATVSSRGTSTLTQSQVTGGAYALNSSSFAFNTAMDFNAAQKASIAAAVPSAASIRDEIDTYSTQLAALVAGVNVAGWGGHEVSVGSGNDPQVVLSGTSVAAVAAGILDLTDGIEASLTLRKALRGMAAVLLGKSSNSGKTFRDTNDTKNRVTATVDSSGNRTAQTLDLT